MHTLSDIHLQFAEAFNEPQIKPLAYLLSKKLQEGNICVTTEDFTEIPESLVKGNYQPDETKIPRLLSTDPLANVPFIKQDDRFYFQRYFRYERNILAKLSSMMEDSARKKAARMEELENHKDIFAALAADYKIEANMTEAERVDWQLIAAIQAHLNDFFIITGGPGTGKTTTLAKLLRILLTINPSAKIAMAAPTGKASMRMAESLRNSTQRFPKLFTDSIRTTIQELPCSTIHKLLEYKRESIYFKRGKDNRLEEDVIIIDEASMIDVPMFSKLLDALKPGARLILLGDKDQLASVEAGSLLGDLCNAIAPMNQFESLQANWINAFIPDKGRVISPSFSTDATHPFNKHITELKLSHRFRAQGKLGALSQAIILGDIDAISATMQESSPNLIFDTEYSDAVLHQFAADFATYIQEPTVEKALKALNEIRVLTTIRQGEKGLYALNKTIELSLESKQLIKPNKLFYENRPIIITRNNYDLDLFNGDIGIVRKDSTGQLRVWFEGKNGEIRSILPAYISDCETVFAMTIHKSQGSEFSKVMVVLPEGTKNPLLTRELLYTGITRTKEKGTLIIRGSEETIFYAAKNAVKRISGLGEQIKNITIQ